MTRAQLEQARNIVAARMAVDLPPHLAQLFSVEIRDDRLLMVQLAIIRGELYEVETTDLTDFAAEMVVAAPTVAPPAGALH